MKGSESGHRYLGPEHVLLGILAEGQSQAAQLLGTPGLDLDAVRRDSEQAFGVRAAGEATWRVTRRRGWRGRRVVWTPLCGPRQAVALQLGGVRR